MAESIKDSSLTARKKEKARLNIVMETSISVNSKMARWKDMQFSLIWRNTRNAMAIG
jgi:hypothetical protein